MNQPNESGAEVRCPCPKCGSYRIGATLGVAREKLVAMRMCLDCQCVWPSPTPEPASEASNPMKFNISKEWSMEKAALEEGCESVECGAPPAQSEAAEGKEAESVSGLVRIAEQIEAAINYEAGRPLRQAIETVKADFASLQAQVEQLKRENAVAMQLLQERADAAPDESILHNAHEMILNKCDEIEAERDQLRADVLRLEKALLNKAGDDLCWFEHKDKGKIPPREEFLKSCAAFHAQIANENGELAGCKTIAQLETDLGAARKELEIALKLLQERADAVPEDHPEAREIARLAQ